MAKAKILGKLRGKIASASEKSRNGRHYTEEFWDTLFDSDLFKEGLENKVYIGELYHPEGDNYEQVHLDDRGAIVLTDVKKDNNLDYIGTFEILPTKAGECMRKLLDVGVKFGVSSRGLADQDSNVFGRHEAENYDLITWDAVAFPGLKGCRLSEIGAVAESFNYNKKDKVKIMESLMEIGNSDSYYGDFINNALKLKEDFDNQFQIEDYLAKYEIEPEFAKYAIYVYVKDDGLVYADDGEHGEKVVNTTYYIDADRFKPGDVYLVDNLIYKQNADSYYATGEWIKLNDDEE